MFQRADFEAVREHNVEIWASEDHLKVGRLTMKCLGGGLGLGSST